MVRERSPMTQRPGAYDPEPRRDALGAVARRVDGRRQQPVAAAPEPVPAQPAAEAQLVRPRRAEAMEAAAHAAPAPAVLAVAVLARQAYAAVLDAPPGRRALD